MKFIYLGRNGGVELWVVWFKSSANFFKFFLLWSKWITQTCNCCIRLCCIRFKWRLESAHEGSSISKLFIDFFGCFLANWSWSINCLIRLFKIRCMLFSKGLKKWLDCGLRIFIVSWGFRRLNQRIKLLVNSLELPFCVWSIIITFSQNVEGTVGETSKILFIFTKNRI